MLKGKILFLLWLIASLILVSCDKEEEDTDTPKTPSMLVVVTDGLYNDVLYKLTTYSEDLTQGDTCPKILKWGTGSVEALRDSIKSYYDQYHIQGVFMIGDLPVAWYEMDDSFGDYEDFPCDLFLMDPYANFIDGDGDGKYDGHSTLDPVVGVARIIGTKSEIKNYFDKVHDYRKNGSLVNQSAYMFLDNDWATYYSSPVLNTNEIYGSDYEICSDLSQTIRSVYIAKLTGTGAEYVHQMIHAYPSALAIYIDNVSKEYVTIDDIKGNNFKVSFYNMFNCSGARFTEENLGMTNVLGTDYGLAIMGTTKTGGNYTPQSFNSALGAGYSWGSAFVEWYKQSGNTISDEWKMGLVLLGDPMLHVSQTTTKSLALIPDLTENQIVQLKEELKEERKNYTVKNFDEYQATHLQYYQGK